MKFIFKPGTTARRLDPGEKSVSLGSLMGKLPSLFETGRVIKAVTENISNPHGVLFLG